MDTMRQTTATD